MQTTTFRKISLAEWIAYCRNYLADKQGKKASEIAKRVQELHRFEQILIQSGALPPVPDDAEESYQQLVAANKALGLKVSDNPAIKERVKGIQDGRIIIGMWEKDQK